MYMLIGMKYNNFNSVWRCIKNMLFILTQFADWLLMYKRSNFSKKKNVKAETRTLKLGASSATDLPIELSERHPRQHNISWNYNNKIFIHKNIKTKKVPIFRYRISATRLFFITSIFLQKMYFKTFKTLYI